MRRRRRRYRAALPDRRRVCLAAPGMPRLPGERRVMRRDQVPTRAVTPAQIMRRPQFALGVADVRAGRRHHADYDLWDTNGQWSYERGRAWAVTAPRHVPLKRLNGELNPAALACWRDDEII